MEKVQSSEEERLILLNPDEEVKETKEIKESVPSTTTSTQQSNTQPSTQRRNNGGGSGSGFLNFLSRMANDIGRGVSNGLIQLEEKIEKEVHTINANGERSFQEDFQFPNTERLLGAFGCRVLNGNTPIGGTAYLSVNHFCFKGGGLKITIPLQTILKVQKALKIRELETRDRPAGPITFQPVPSNARGDCLQLYTNDRMVHHFFSDPLSFGPLHNAVLTFETWYRMVDEAWKYANAASRESTQATYQPQPAPAEPLQHEQQQVMQATEPAPESQQEKEQEKPPQDLFQ